MTRNDRAPKDLELTAAEYVLGTIEGDERLGFERRLAQDPAARRAVETWEQRLAGLDALEGESAPPDGLWSRIEALIDDGGPDTLTIRAEEGEWHEIYPGIQRKMLYRNAADGTQSYLLRIAPGAEIPAHPRSGSP